MLPIGFKETDWPLLRLRGGNLDGLEAEIVCEHRNIEQARETGRLKASLVKSVGPTTLPLSNTRLFTLKALLLAVSSPPELTHDLGVRVVVAAQVEDGARRHS